MPAMSRSAVIAKEVGMYVCFVVLSTVENINSAVMRSTMRTIEKSGATAHEGETNALEGCHAEEFSLL